MCVCVLSVCVCVCVVLKCTSVRLFSTQRVRFGLLSPSTPSRCTAPWEADAAAPRNHGAFHCPPLAPSLPLISTSERAPRRASRSSPGRPSPSDSAQAPPGQAPRGAQTSAEMVDTLKMQRYEALLAPLIAAMQPAAAALPAPPRVFLIHAWAETAAEDARLFPSVLLLQQLVSRCGGRPVSALSDWRLTLKDDPLLFEADRAVRAAAPGEAREAARAQLQAKLERSYAAFCRRELASCCAALAAASPSFKALAESPQQNPVRLALAAAEEAGLEPLPLVLLGGFRDAIPAALAGVLGGSLGTVDAFFQYGPKLVATALGVVEDAAVQASLTDYDKVRWCEKAGARCASGCGCVVRCMYGQHVGVEWRWRVCSGGTEMVCVCMCGCGDMHMCIAIGLRRKGPLRAAMFPAQLHTRLRFQSNGRNVRFSDALLLLLSFSSPFPIPPPRPASLTAARRPSFLLLTRTLPLSKRA